MSYLLAFFVLALLKNTTWKEKTGLYLIQRSLVIIVGGAFAYNLTTLLTVRERIDVHYTHYGWNRDASLSRVYEANQVEYTKAISRVYGDNMHSSQYLQAAEHAEDYGKIDREISSVFPNQRIPLKNIGLAYPKFSAWVNSPEWRFVNIPEELESATVVDNFTLPVRGFIFFRFNVQEPSEAINKLQHGNPLGLITVLPRPDLEVYLFSKYFLPESSQSNSIKPTQFKIVLADSSGHRLGLVGSEITNYLEIDPAYFKNDAFFIIRQKPLL
jgi:hypothetical protein